MVKIGEILYLTVFDLNCIVALNFSIPSEAKLITTNVSPSYGRVDKSAIAGCMQGTISYLISKMYYDNFLYIYQVLAEDFSKLTMISKYFINDFIQTMTTSLDCSTLYTGGDSFRVFNVKNMSSIILTYQSMIPNILTMTLASYNILYINTAFRIYFYYENYKNLLSMLLIPLINF